MYGVCRTLVREGRASYAAWWYELRQEWLPQPDFAGVFATKEEAVAFVNSLTNMHPLEYHVHEAGDPFGGERVLPKRTIPTLGQLKECGVVQNDIPAQEN